MKIIKWTAVVLGALLLLGMIGFVVWASNPVMPMTEAQAAMQSGEKVTVQSEPWMIFQPAEMTPTSGLIFYPGGRVDPRAYAPAARKIAEQGYLVVIVPMPLNLAVFGAGKAEDVVASFPEIENWVIAGHSVGGSMAARFAAKNPEKIDGLALWAAYPAGSDNLSDLDMEAVSIYGTQDGLAASSEIKAGRPLLPQNTQWVAIEGGNHAQFGWYGPQGGDNEASISRADQQDQIVQATLELLATIDSDR